MNISNNKQYQWQSIDYWVDDTLGD